MLYVILNILEATVRPYTPISQTIKDMQDMLGTAGEVRTNW